MAGSSDSRLRVERPAGAASLSARRARLFRRAVLVLVGVLLLALVVQAYRRFHEPEEKKELLRYFHSTHGRLHAQVKSVQAAIAGLLDETAPEPQVAVRILDDNVMPTLDRLIEEARALRFDTLDVRVLHQAYTEAVIGLRGDAAAMRAVFADANLSPTQKKYRAFLLRDSMLERFAKFAARAEELWAHYGIFAQTVLAPKPPTLTPRSPARVD